MTEANKKTGKTIEALAVKEGINSSILEGVKVGKKWGAGKIVTESAFKTAVKDFLNSPADGRKVNKKNKDASGEDGKS